MSNKLKGLLAGAIFGFILVFFNVSSGKGDLDNKSYGAFIWGSIIFSFVGWLVGSSIKDKD